MCGWMDLLEIWDWIGVLKIPKSTGNIRKGIIE
jgi:hypothetical protein